MLALLLGGWGCAAAPRAVSPAEIPELRAAIETRPDDADLRLRHAAALFAGGDCAAARAEVEVAAALRPDKGLGPLIHGQCLEAEGRVADAVDVYTGYLRAYPDAEGADAVRGRLVLAERIQVAAEVRAALAREADLAAEGAAPGTVAVLPVAVLGDVDDRYRGLSSALAQMLVSDLSLVTELRLVERSRVDLLLRELALAESGRVDPTTAARVGRLLRAGELVQGTLAVDPAALRLEATIARLDGAADLVDPGAAGDLRLLLDLEKRLALAVAQRLAGPLTPADERRILDNGTESVAAFLLWADGLILEEEGDYRAASAAYRAAAHADPSFVDADERARRTAAAAALIGRPPAEVVGAVRAARQAAAGFPALAGVAGDALRDVGSLGPEVALGSVPAAPGVLWSPGTNQPVPPLPAGLLLRILVRIPR